MAEVWGSSFIETASDKIKTLLDALVTQMATGYDPKLSYVYQRHDTADIQLNAATIDLERVDDMTVIYANAAEPGSFCEVVLSVRVHTDWAPKGIMDGQKNMRLLNSIMNKLLSNLNLGSVDGCIYRVKKIEAVNPRQVFETTFGGSLDVIVMVTPSHTQE